MDIEKLINTRALCKALLVNNDISLSLIKQIEEQAIDTDIYDEDLVKYLQYGICAYYEYTDYFNKAIERIEEIVKHKREINDNN